DEPLWQANLTDLLHRAGFNVVSAFDYSDALNQLQRLSPLPALAIVDLDLPSSIPQEGWDGLRILTVLREKGIFAIVVSVNTRPSAESLPARPEVYDVVDKVRFTAPDFEQYFVAKVHAAVGHAVRARQAEGKLLEQQNRLRRLAPPHS